MIMLGEARHIRDERQRIGGGNRKAMIMSYINKYQ